MGNRTHPVAKVAPRRKPRYFDPLPAAKPGPRKRSALRRRVSGRLLSRLTTQLATLMEAGLPIVRSLRILEGQLPPGPLKAVVGAVAEDVEGGASLSEALAKHPTVFDTLYVEMIRAGEAGGMLDQVLRRLADFKEKAERLRTQVRGAITYPAFVLTFALGVIFFITTVVVPQFQKIFRDLGADQLPRITLILLSVSEFLRRYWWAVLALPFLLIVTGRLVRRHPRGRFLTDRWGLKLPLLGRINHKNKIARVGRTLGTLLGSGVPLLEGLEITRNVMGNRVLEDALERVRGAVKEGEGLAVPMGQTRLFDDMIVNMIQVGEETGELDRMLIRIADTYEYEVDVEVAALTRLLEPALILFVGGIVAFILFATFLPLLEIIRKLGQGG